MNGRIVDIRLEEVEIVATGVAFLLVSSALGKKMSKWYVLLTNVVRKE